MQVDTDSPAKGILAGVNKGGIRASLIKPTIGVCMNPTVTFKVGMRCGVTAELVVVMVAVIM